MARPAATFAAAGGIPAGSRLNAASAAQQAAASSALPSIQSPPPPSGAAVGPQTLFYQRITIGAGKIYPIVVRGAYVYVEGIFFNNPGTTQAPIYLRPDTQQTKIPLTEPFREIRFPEPFATLEIDNTANFLSDVTIAIWVGFGQIRRDYSERGTTIATDPLIVPVGGLMAANQCVGTTPWKFSSPTAVSPFTQNGRLVKAILTKNSAVTLNADFTLYFFKRDPGAYAHGSSFSFSPAGAFQIEDIVGQIRFPTFYAGGGGASLCDISDVSIALDAMTDLAGPPFETDGTLWGVLVTNAAYFAGLDQFSAKLFLRS